MSKESLKKAGDELKRVMRKVTASQKEWEKAKQARSRKTRLAQESAEPPRK